MPHHARYRVLTATTAIVVGLGLAGYAPAGVAAQAHDGHHDGHHHHGHHQKGHAEGLPGGYKHLVVIYEENHSFDNLYGTWGDVRGQHVEGLADASSAKRTQVGQDGVPFTCLQQVDVNLASPVPLSNTCQDPGHAIDASHFGNDIFDIDDFIAPTDRTCPVPVPGVPSPANGVPKVSRTTTPADAPATSCTASTRRSTRSTAASRTATRRAPTRSASPRACTRPSSCRSTATCTARAHRGTSSPTASSRAPAVARSSTTSG